MLLCDYLRFILHRLHCSHGLDNHWPWSGLINNPGSQQHTSFSHTSNLSDPFAGINSTLPKTAIAFNMWHPLGSTEELHMPIPTNFGGGGGGVLYLSDSVWQKRHYGKMRMTKNVTTNNTHKRPRTHKIAVTKLEGKSPHQKPRGRFDVDWIGVVITGTLLLLQ
jgi:hypothetical protein